MSLNETLTYFQMSGKQAEDKGHGLFFREAAQIMTLLFLAFSPG